MTDSTEHKREPTLNWFLWWQVGSRELSRQVERYSTLPFMKSARGLAAFCLIISVVLTVALIAFGALPIAGGATVIIMLPLALFIYLGHRWANLAAMVWWTIEKAAFLFEGFASGGGNPVTHVIWWCIFMHAFYLSYRVEQQRRKALPDAASYFT